MTAVKSRGFTIIEVILFLGISGAMFAALIVGMNGTITQQRYRESVRSYAAFLQQQFSEVESTHITRTNELKCALGDDGRAVVSDRQQGGDIPGSPSDNPACVMLGRAIDVTNGGLSIRVLPVVGVYDETVAQGQLSDIQTLTGYGPNTTSKFSTVSYDIEWGSELKTVNKAPFEASFLILRSPSSGLIRVFASNSSLPADIRSLVTVANATIAIKSCIDGQRGLLPMQSVTVDTKVAGQDSIITQEFDTAC